MLKEKVKLMKTTGLLLSLVLLLSACQPAKSSDVPEPDNKKETKTYKIGILQIAEHPALDDARKGFIDQLAAEGVDVEISYKNAQGDLPTASTLASQFVQDKVDLIYAIATPAAQSAKQATQEIPILFSAVTDPVGAGLVKQLDQVGGNATGTTDKTPTAKQLALFEQVNPSIHKIGIIYNTSEINSQVQMEEAVAEATKLGLEVMPVGINNISEMAQALDTLMDKTDGLYNLTDNLIASSIGLISEKALDKKKVIVQSYIDETEEAKGILISNGFSYYDLGKQTGEMAVKILVEDQPISQIPVGTIEKTENVVSQVALDQLAIDKELPVIKEARLIHQ